MTRSAILSAAAALAIALAAGSVAGCKKDAAKNEPAKTDERRAAADQLVAPPLFAHIPADSPYVFAAFEPFPDSYWKMIAEAVRPVAEEFMKEVSAAATEESADDPGAALAAAVARELDGNLNAAGLRKLVGVTSAARFAIYGIGPVPVFRLELADPAALTATVERVAKAANLTLPEQTIGDRTYWRIEEDDKLFVVAVADNQLIVAGGPVALVDGALAFIVGTEKPSPNMADGAALKEVIKRHGFSGNGVGYVDAEKLLMVLQVAQVFGGDMAPACMPVLSQLARQFPRLAVGYDEVNEKTSGMRAVLEMEPALLARLADLQVEVPGMSGGVLADPAVFAMGGGLDLARGQALVLSAADGLAAIGAACGGDLAADAAELKAAVSQPLPPAVAKLKGGLVALLDAKISGGVPSEVKGYGYVAAEDPAALLELVKKEMPGSDQLVIQKDGLFHQLVPAGTIPGLEAVQAALKDKALVVAVGAGATDAAERALQRGGKAPLLFFSYDYGRLLSMGTEAMGQLGNDLPGMNDKLASLFGTAAFWLYVSDYGLALGFRTDMKQ